MDTITELSYWYNLVITYMFMGLTWLFEEFHDFAWIVKVAAISLTISVWLILVSLVRLGQYSFARWRWKRLERKLIKRYGDAINFILSPESHNNMTREEVLELLNIAPQDAIPPRLLKDWRQRMCMSRIIYQARISEEAQVKDSRNLQVLLNIFGLINFLEEVILRNKEHLKAEALLMLRAFKVSSNQWIANQLINSKKKRIKRMAMYTSVMTSSNSDLEYFESDFFKENFSLYDEIQLGFVLQRRVLARRKIPNLAHWATIHEDPRTQAMFVRMMRQFNQKEYCGELEDMFNHNTDIELLEEIARTWGYLGYTEGEELMSDMMLTQPDNGKVAIMHALTRLNTGKSLGTLLDGYRNSGTPFVRFEALRCIYLYGDEGKKKFNELKENAHELDSYYFEFFKNDLTLEDIPLEKTARYHSRYGDNLYSVG